jgi:hypothetical protein
MLVLGPGGDPVSEKNEPKNPKKAPRSKNHRVRVRDLEVDKDSAKNVKGGKTEVIREPEH